MDSTELTKEEKQIYNFMMYSGRINGMIIVPPWMLSEAKEVCKKLGIQAEENQPIEYSNLNPASEWAKMTSDRLKV